MSKTRLDLIQMTGRIKIDAIINCVNRESNFRRNINDQFELRLNT